MTRTILFLGVLVLASALSVVYLRHLNRTVFVQAQTLQDERDELNIEWAKLLLEQATWSVNVVESVARKELKLHIPSSQQTQFIRSSGITDG